MQDRKPAREGRDAMTAAEAVLIKLIQRYLMEAFELDSRDLHKLVYLVEQAGERSGMRFEMGLFGPESAGVVKMLKRMHGRLDYDRGGSQYPEVHVTAAGAREASAVLREHPESKSRLARLRSLIEGFEAPDGLEVLASVLWVARRDGSVTDAASATAAVHGLNERLQQVLRADHVREAWEQLDQLGWLAKA